MGIIECEIHGRVAGLPLCEHLLENINSDTKSDKMFGIWTSLGKIYPDAGEIGMGIIFCLKCAKEKDIPSETSLISNAEFEKIDKDNIKYICSFCLEKYLERHNISPDDFMV